MPGLIVRDKSGSDTKLYSLETSKQDIFGFRLPYRHESERLSSYKRLHDKSVVPKYSLTVITWPDEQISKVKVSLINDLKDLNDKIGDLGAQVTQATKEILAGQEEIKSKLDDLSGKISEDQLASEERDLRLQALILNQGREIKNLVNSGSNGAVENLGKWWPREQKVSEGFIARHADDGQSLLQKLHDRLESSKSIVITGMGGIGKTTTVKWFAAEYCGDFSHIIWLESEDFSKSLRALADALLIPLLLNDNLTQKSLENLSAEIYTDLKEQKCLFLLDNVDDPSIKKLLSTMDKHYFLLTSRLQRWQGLNVLEVGLFSSAEALEYLGLNIASSRQGNPEDVKTLAELLQFLPLAMNQAAACIEGLELTVKEYLDEFNQKSKTLLDMTTETGKTVMTTLTISIDQMMQKNHGVGTVALKILNALSFLKPERIPKTVLQHLAPNKIELGKALDLLKSYSLIKSGYDGSIEIHRLVQEAMRVRLQEVGDYDKVLHDLLTALHNKVLLNFKSADLAEQMKSVLSFTSQKKHKLLTLKCREVKALIVRDVNMNNVEAYMLQAEILESLKKYRHGSDTHVDVLMAKNRLANTNWVIGQIHGALQIMALVNWSFLNLAIFTVQSLLYRYT